MLDLPEVPDLYLTQMPFANAFTIGAGRADDRPQLGARAAARHRRAARGDRARGHARPVRARAVRHGAADPAAALLPAAAARGPAVHGGTRGAARVVARGGADVRPRRGGRQSPADGRMQVADGAGGWRGDRRSQPRRVHRPGPRLPREGQRPREAHAAVHRSRHHPPDAGTAHPRAPEVGARGRLRPDRRRRVHQARRGAAAARGGRGGRQRTTASACATRSAGPATRSRRSASSSATGSRSSAGGRNRPPIRTDARTARRPRCAASAGTCRRAARP